MIKEILLIILGLLFIADFPGLEAQEESTPPEIIHHNCTWPPDMEKWLIEKAYKKNITLHSHRTWILQLWNHSRRNVWYLVRIMPNGCARIVDMGQGWNQSMQEYL